VTAVAGNEGQALDCLAGEFSARIAMASGRRGIDGRALACMTNAAAIVAACATVLLGACATPPPYNKPQLEMPPKWKLESPWREGTPNDAAPKGAWWQRFGDADLETLERKALADSPNLAVATARLDQARAQLAAADASRYPQLGANARAQRAGVSANRPLTNYNSPNFGTIQNDFIPQLTASYEVDLAGRVRSTIEGAQATAEQAAIDLENTRLVLTADLATAYFNLRATDIELDALSRSIGLQRRALELATARHDLGATSGLDVAQQQALLDSTLTQVDVLRRQRGGFEHAVATLTGTGAPVFELPSKVQVLLPPAVPLGVPSDILERRPDVASAERAMAAANAQIGIANAAFYPSFTLGAAFGSETRLLPALFDAPSLIWSIGTTVAGTIFDGGRLQATLEAARAGYDATVGTYRRTVLTAMQEVEDGITGMASLERAYEQALVANASAQRVLDLAMARYEGGAASYSDVITAQQGLLNSERLAAQLLGQRLLSAVFLVRALGGDWQGTGKLAQH
jgi:NodT family efflux transporter outer membrane factor (OMF) lipoprotein